MKLSLVVGFLLFINLGCLQSRNTTQPRNAPITEVSKETKIKSELTFLELKKNNADYLSYRCSGIAGDTYSYQSIYREIDPSTGKPVEGFDGVLAFFEEAGLYKVEGNTLYSSSAGGCEFELLEGGKFAVIYGRNELYDNLVVVNIAGHRFEDISSEVRNLYDDPEIVQYQDSLLYQSRLKAVNSRIAVRDSILGSIFVDLVGHEDKEKQLKALGHLVSRLHAAGTFNWHNYDFPTDLQKRRYKEQYIEINDRLASLVADSDSLFYWLANEPGEIRKRVVRLLGYLHPMTSSLVDGWEWPDEPVPTTMDISSTRRAIFRAVLESKDSNAAEVVLSQRGFDLAGMEQLIFQHLYAKSYVRKTVLDALDRITKPSDAVLDSLEKYIKKRQPEPQIYNAIIRHRSDRAAIILLEYIFSGRRVREHKKVWGTLKTEAEIGDRDCILSHVSFMSAHGFRAIIPIQDNDPRCKPHDLAQDSHT